MKIQHHKKENEGSFFIKDQEELLAEMLYRQNSPEVFIIEHTEVSEKLKGQGIGKKLVQEAVDFARKENKKIKATCSFAKSVLLRNEAMHDVFIDD